jgi:arabinose-5-phosphate isomerase
MGMGKSGHVGRKIAATLASTGTPALFVHPAEASHGDLGMITPADVVLAISNSGESASSTPSCRWSSAWAPADRHDRRAQSTLARHADLVLDSGVEKEACPLNLAPTASTTAQMALGDALAVACWTRAAFAPKTCALAPRRCAGPQAAHPCARRDAHGDAVPASARGPFRS